MCKATLSLGLCCQCRNVDLVMTSSKFCSKVQPGDVCRDIAIRMDQAAYVRNQLPKGHCRACRVAQTGNPGKSPVSIRGQPVEPIIEYYVLTRNKKAADAAPGPHQGPRVVPPWARHGGGSVSNASHPPHPGFFVDHGYSPMPPYPIPGLHFPAPRYHDDHLGNGPRRH